MRGFYQDVDTPALIIDREITMQNIEMMQKRADELGVVLRPHIKTHRMTYFSKIQMEQGAVGVACAKIGEAEEMARAGIRDIFIANEIVGKGKYQRLKQLHRKVKIRVGVDNSTQVDQMEEVFAGEERPLEVLIEYEVGEGRSGVITDGQLTDLVRCIQSKRNVLLKGIFSHEGHTYKAESMAECVETAKEAYEKTIRAADLIRGLGVEIETVSVGATPSVLSGVFLKGITEFRLGTYIFFDLGQANALGTFSSCAATVLATVISKPNDERIVLDAGAKALVPQNRSTGICATNGFGCIKGDEGVRIAGLYDEHAVINSLTYSQRVQVGDKVEVIPSHICPTVNLYDKAYLVSRDQVVDVIPIDCRGKSQ